MKNTNLKTDFNNLRGDWQINQVVDEAERYIEYLEGKEDRLIQIENALNDIEASDMANKQDFLAKFQGFKNV